MRGRVRALRGRPEHAASLQDRGLLGRLRAERGQPDVAFLKFCYIDVNAGTDVRTLFRSIPDYHVRN